jgi:hypothetical protein
MRAACLDLYLDLPQACQYKHFLKEDIVKSRGPLFTVTIAFTVLQQNIKHKSIN